MFQQNAPGADAPTVIQSVIVELAFGVVGLVLILIGGSPEIRSIKTPRATPSCRCRAEHRPRVLVWGALRAEAGLEQQLG
jgi:hypothetical protein